MRWRQHGFYHSPALRSLYGWFDIRCRGLPAVDYRFGFACLQDVLYLRFRHFGYCYYLRHNWIPIHEPDYLGWRLDILPFGLIMHRSTVTPSPVASAGHTLMLRPRLDRGYAIPWP